MYEKNDTYHNYHIRIIAKKRHTHASWYDSNIFNHGHHGPPERATLALRSRCQYIQGFMGLIEIPVQTCKPRYSMWAQHHWRDFRKATEKKTCLRNFLRFLQLLRLLKCYYMQAKAPLRPTKSDALGVHEPQVILPLTMYSCCDFRAIAPL